MQSNTFRFITIQEAEDALVIDDQTPRLIDLAALGGACEGLVDPLGSSDVSSTSTPSTKPDNP